MKIFEPILDAGEGFLNTIAIGRVDSLALWDCQGSILILKNFTLTKDLALHARNRGIKVGMGGGISFEAIPYS